MTTMDRPYTQVQMLRYQIMQAHMCKELRRLEQAGTLSAYMQEVERRYRDRKEQLMYPCLTILDDNAPYVHGDDQRDLEDEAARLADAMAIREIVETY